MRLKKYLTGLILGLALAPFAAQALQEYPATDAVSFQAALDAAEIDMEDSRIVLAAGEYHTSDNGMGQEFSYVSGEGFGLEIQGAGVGQTILDGDDSTRVLNIFDTSFQILSVIDHVTISGVSVVDGLVEGDAFPFGGGVLISSLFSGIDRIEIRDSEFQNNRIQDVQGGFLGSGGGVFLSAFFNTLELVNNTFGQNSASSGGGIANIALRLPEVDQAPLILGSGLIDFQNNQFLGNQANFGAGADLTSLTSFFERNNFEGNIAQFSAGGLALFNFVEANLNSNRFVRNQALRSTAGGLWILSAPKASVTNAIVVGNTASNFAGGIQYGTQDIDLIQESSVKDWVSNHTPNEDEQKNLDDWISADIAAGPGLTLTHNTISDNEVVSGDGGGVAIILDPQFGEGGLEGIEPDTVDIYNNIIYGNRAGGDGADIYVSDFALQNLIAGPVIFAATVNLFNNDYSDFFSECQNNVDCMGENNVNEDETTNIDLDPLFADLANADVHLTGGSPAIDTGDLDPPGFKTLDYDLVTRPIGPAPDMGALEAAPAIEVNPLEYDFGNVLIGESESTVITIRSIGAAPLQVSDISLADTTNFSFDVNGGGDPCGSEGPNLPSGESCTISATFGPESLGAKNTTLTVDSNAANDPSVPVLLRGNGIDDDADGFLEGSGFHSLFGCSLNAQAATSFSGLAWMFAGLPLVAMLRKRRS